MLSDLSLDQLPRNERNQIGGSKVENYKRIKQEEADARAQLLMPSRGALIDQSNQAAAAFSSDSKVQQQRAYGIRNSEMSANRRYRPSENALQAYSPLRNIESQAAIP